MTQARSRSGGSAAVQAWVLLAFLLPAPWIFLDMITHKAAQMSPGVVSLFSGLAIIGAAFLLSWAVELAERDIPQNLALVLLALLAILPEYAVDLTFAWIAASDPEYVEYTVANMTGANRLLIGLGWPLIVLLYCLKFRKREVILDPRQGLEIAFLLMATLYSFLLPIKGFISLYDTVILFALFGLYAWTASRVTKQHVELAGPAAFLDELLGDTGRRAWVLGTVAYAGFAIYVAAHPFAEGLVESGKHYGIPPFLLVQWLAPIASESPEAVIAIIFAIRARPSTAMGALSSSVVNQWTLLVGAIPLVYSLGRGEISAMPLVPRQVEELLLTSGQSLFAVAIIANFGITLWEAAVLMGLFIAHVFMPSTELRLIFAFGYIVLALAMLLVKRDRRRLLFRLLLSRGRPTSPGFLPPGPDRASDPQAERERHRHARKR
jgi:cation:H+ antiporter